MNLADVMDDVAARIDTIPGLRVSAFPPDQVQVPAAVVTYPEAYTFDAVSSMGYRAARTSTVEIAAGILPIYTRTPTLIAMTAAWEQAFADSLVGEGEGREQGQQARRQREPRGRGRAQRSLGWYEPIHRGKRLSRRKPAPAAGVAPER